MLDPFQKLSNPPPGTVVDHTVTRRNHFDFFLVSQKVNEVSPVAAVLLLPFQWHWWSSGCLVALSSRVQF